MGESQRGGDAGRGRYRIFAVICLSYILVYFHRLCPAVIALDMQESFGTSATLLGVLGSAYFYPYAIMQLPTGLLVDSWGPRKTVSSFFLLAAVGSVLMGTASNLTLAMVGRLLVGVGVSTLFVSNFKLLAEWFTPREFVVMGGIFMATGGLGALSAPRRNFSARRGQRRNLLGPQLQPDRRRLSRRRAGSGPDRGQPLPVAPGCAVARSGARHFTSYRGGRGCLRETTYGGSPPHPSGRQHGDRCSRPRPTDRRRRPIRRRRGRRGLRLSRNSPT